MKKTNESCESYLKAIYMLQNSHGYVRSIDIADMLGVSKASVCVAMKKLQREALIEMDDDKFVHLTSEGEKCAREVINKYNLIKQALISLNVDEQTAAQDACRIEHLISSETANRIETELNRHRNPEVLLTNEYSRYILSS